MDRWNVIIEENPIGGVLDDVREDARSKGVYDAAAVDNLCTGDLRSLGIALLYDLRTHRAAHILPGSSGGMLSDELETFGIDFHAADNDSDRLRQLLKGVLENKDDFEIWRLVWNLTEQGEISPPPHSMPSSLPQISWVRNKSSFSSSGVYRKHVNRILRKELGHTYIDIPNFCDRFFSGVDGLKVASELFFTQCSIGPSPIFDNGWKNWPYDAGEEEILDWFREFSENLVAFAADRRPGLTRQRTLWTDPNTQINEPVRRPKLSVGFVDAERERNTRHHWSQTLVPGDLQSDASADNISKAWLNIGRYARALMAAQYTRRFVLGFTLCDSLMRVWAFDRLGAIASEQFDINKDGLQFIYVMLGFFWISKEELGFDSTIQAFQGKHYIEIERNGSKERIVIDRPILRPRRIAGRATTCWLAHPEGHPETPLVIKDSWQRPERDEEGEILSEVTSRRVVNVARYYHHETVQIRGVDDDIQNCIRRGLDITSASNFGPSRPQHSVRAASPETRKSRTSGSRSRSRSTKPPSPARTAIKLQNRVHRRIIVRDYGKAIYKASSRKALLAGLEGCIKGHESLHYAGILHRDISISNLVINEDPNNPSWSSFLIDLEFAVREDRDLDSDAESKVGTRAFMAIGLLRGEVHTFMHDLESFFWVLFWICVHYAKPGKQPRTTFYDRWHSEADESLAALKADVVYDKARFEALINRDFTPFFKPLIPHLVRLRDLFPFDDVQLPEEETYGNGVVLDEPDPQLYSRMMEVLREAQDDPAVLAR
ncbi:hypothetical protein E4U30_005993 [Claviceps sp. LM220 group G6]|nr:hypothetical protein E4U30_005993 [Claviceps sp. LM220 group G6]KAG6109296.1 hypothetical protein E4U31_006996 [Claviceps sp. LM219 group G6]